MKFLEWFSEKGFFFTGWWNWGQDLGHSPKIKDLTPEPLTFAKVKVDRRRLMCDVKRLKFNPSVPYAHRWGLHNLNINHKRAVWVNWVENGLPDLAHEVFILVVFWRILYSTMHYKYAVFALMILTWLQSFPIAYPMFWLLAGLAHNPRFVQRQKRVSVTVKSMFDAGSSTIKAVE